MSLFILDTDIVTLLQRSHARVCQNVHAHLPAQLAITVLTVEEQLSGWYAWLRNAKQPAQLARGYQELVDAVRFFGSWQILSFSVSAIARYDHLTTLKLNVRKMDLRIAAVVLENGGVLVTRNLRDFQRVPNLIVENWAV
jgi:tRNA(fMet)-specific endonuclease VapC